MNKVGVLIATSMNRSEFLIHRALKSILNQTFSPDCIVIVDDNKADDFVENKNRIDQLSIPNLYYIKNQRTKNNSGTGAWNTGFDFLKKFLGEKSYVAILDDDDEWESTHLESCIEKIKCKLYKAVFSYLKRQDCPKASIFNIQDLTIDNFLIGSPGIQGSNMFFNLKSLLEINGFDERLPSCTDRDLMIRFIQTHGVEDIAIVPKVLVKHYTTHDTVTSNFDKKEKGLDFFYRKHLHLFESKILDASLQRAEKLFQYKNSTTIRQLFSPKIAIGIAMHNNAKTIRRCLKSILFQKNLKKEVVVVIGNDFSTDEWQIEIQDLLDNFYKNIKILNLSHKNVVKTRNDINRFIVEELGNVNIIGRLDSDDEFCDLEILAQVESIIDTYQPDLILTGNRLRIGEKIIDRVNRATAELLDKSYLDERLKKMSEGDKEAELPSCNLFITPKHLKNYPNLESAEDHALLVEYLLDSCKYQWYFAENLLTTIYSLSGNITQDNKNSKSYLDCRKKIYENFKLKMNG